MSISSAQALWDYYAAAAAKLGREKLSDGRDGRDMPYSVHWYFKDHSPERNILTRAFLGERHALTLVRRAILGQADEAELDELYDGRGSAGYDENDFLEGSPRPDEAQREAIRTALAMPISFIKGPPGTGKTSAILHLMSCILRRNRTAAMVSSNNMAIKAITDKLDTYAGSAEPKQRALYNAFARLGNQTCREMFAKAHPELFGEKCKTSADMKSERFLAAWPIIASTINSLPKCFADWNAGKESSRREPVYDYVIVDESSQVNALLGLMAMGGARHLVLVGDDDQLPPVTDEDRIQAGTEKEAGQAAGILPRGFENIYALRDGRSFLRACRDVFLAGDEALEERCARMLYCHYRCHPGIIGFCRQEVYSGGRTPLEIRTRDYDHSVRTPIRVVWFEGEFCEGICQEQKNARGEIVSHWSKCSRRQSEIFMQEEWPVLLDRLCADPCSVLDLDMEGRRPFRFGVLSPFRGQLWDLRDRLSRWMKDEDHRKMIQDKAAAHREEFLAVLEDVGVETYLAQPDHQELAGRVRQVPGDPAQAVVDLCIESLPDRLRPFILGEDTAPGRRSADPEEDAAFAAMEVALPELTVHKAQGQEYDVVYFLPVYDNLWEWPWSQKKRLINVAVSRARQELCIILSTALMDERIQQALAGEEAVIPPQAPDEDCAPEEDAFLRKLIRYVWDNGPDGPGPWTDGPFGFHRARTRSLFDRAAGIGRRLEEEKPRPSAPEICLQDWLSRLPLVVDNGLSLYINVPISAVTPPPVLPEDLPDREELMDYIGKGAHFDCLVCREGRILMAIEVDGEHHRTVPEKRQNDVKKNAVVSHGFGAAVYTAAEDGAVLLEGSALAEGSSFTFLRLPTDGTAWDEERTIGTLLAERLQAEGEPAYTLPVWTLADLLADLPAGRRRYVFGVLSEARDWNTGLPVQEKTPGARWLPKPAGERRGLMMAYLPDGGDYWKAEKRLRPSMVCRADAWKYLSVSADRRKNYY